MLYIRFISLVTKAGATRRGLFLLLFFSLFSPSLSFYFLFFRPERKNWKREKTKRPNKIPTMCSRKKKNWTIHLYNLVFHGLIYISLKRQKGTSLSFPSLTVSFILALFFFFFQCVCFVTLFVRVAPSPRHWPGPSDIGNTAVPFCIISRVYWP